MSDHNDFLARASPRDWSKPEKCQSRENFDSSISIKDFDIEPVLILYELPLKLILASGVSNIQGEHLSPHLDVHLERVQRGGSVAHGDLVNHEGQHHGGLPWT